MSPKEDKSRLATRLGIALYLLVSVVYLFLGQANSDEGWYLYASKLVFEGALPYRDFAYTQMPLLPYLYGAVQILHPGLFLGRLTSVIISFGTLGMSIVIARRHAGRTAGAIAALLMATFTFSIYYNSIVKTYALVSFCFAATLFVLSSDWSETWKYLLALAYAFVAVLVRETALFFAGSILVYILFAAQYKARVFVLLESAAAGVIGGFFVLPDWPAASWDLLGSHLNHWGGAPLFDQVKEILTVRLPDIAQHFGPLLVLGTAALYFVLQRRDKNSWPRDPAPLAAATVGLVLFAASHLLNGIWQLEYLVPAATVFVPLLAIALSRLQWEAMRPTRVFVQGTVIAVMILLPLGESTQHTDITGERLPLSEIQQVANFVAQNSKTTDSVLALEALDVVVDADRSALPGMTLAQFSLQNMDTASAQRLHVVNYYMVAKAIARKDARVVVLTDADLSMLTDANPIDPEALPRSLDENYRQALVMNQFGQYSRTVFVYLSR